jgi:two-component system cell cycle response regulator
MDNSGNYWEFVIDGLTGLPNRRYLQLHLAAEYERARSLHHPLSLLALDFDHFREINRIYLLPGGDKVLAEVARLVARSVRPSDRVVRDGGDQFSVILPDTGAEDAYQEGEWLRQVIASGTVEVQGSPLTVTVCVGVATATFEEAEAWDLFVRARNAVHKGKESGRNRVEVA